MSLHKITNLFTSPTECSYCTLKKSGSYFQQSVIHTIHSQLQLDKFSKHNIGLMRYCLQWRT